MTDESLGEVTFRKENNSEMSPRKEESLPKTAVGLIMVLIIAAGGLSGFFLAKVKGGKGELGTVKEGEVPQVVKKGQVVGSTDKEAFKDQAMGRLEKNGGDNQEGTHKLIREGGPDQTAFLISSVIDLDDYVGRKVEIWGETFYSDRVGWLMDVGRLEVLD